MSVIRVNFSLLTFVIIIFVSCEKELEYAFPLGEQLVVIGEISPQDGLIIQLSKSIPNTNTTVTLEDILIDDALVYLHHNDLSFKVFPSGEGLFLLTNEDHIIKPDSTYTITIEHADFGIVTSNPLTIPSSITSGVSLETKKTGGLWCGNTGMPEYAIQLSWQDIPNATNYLIQLDALTDPVIPLQAKINSTEFFGACQIINAQPPVGIYFDDFCFEDEKIELEILTGSRDSVYLGNSIQAANNWRLRLASVNEDYINYQNSHRPLETEAGIAEPTETFSNINGGLGIITAVNKLEFFFEPPQ